MESECMAHDVDAELSQALNDFPESDAAWTATPTPSIANHFRLGTAAELADALGLPCSAFRFQETTNGEDRAAAVAYNSEDIVAVIHVTDLLDADLGSDVVTIPGIGPVTGHIDEDVFVGTYQQDMMLVILARGHRIDDVASAFIDRGSTVCETDCLR